MHGLIKSTKIAFLSDYYKINFILTTVIENLTHYVIIVYYV